MAVLHKLTTLVYVYILYIGYFPWIFPHHTSVQYFPILNTPIYLLILYANSCNKYNIYIYIYIHTHQLWWHCWVEIWWEHQEQHRCLRTSANTNTQTYTMRYSRVLVLHDTIMPTRMPHPIMQDIRSSALYYSVITLKTCLLLLFSHPSLMLKWYISHYAPTCACQPDLEWDPQAID